MGVRDLFFAIKARDETGAAFQAVRDNLRAVDGMAATASTRFRQYGAGLATIGAGLTAATAPLLIAFSDSLQLYDDAARAAAKVETAVKSTGGAAGLSAESLFEVAAGLQDITRFDGDDVLNKVTAQLLTFTNIAGDNFLRAQVSALDLATTLDGDLQSASIMLGKALNDPIKGLSAMGKAGIQFSEDQKAVIAALVETGDLAGAQVVILEELEKQYGGQAAAAALAGMGAMDQLRNSWGDLKEEVGAVIADILPPMVDFFKSLIDGFQALPEPVKTFTVTLGLIAAVAGPTAIALGGLVFALGAISAPVLLVAGGIAALTALLAAFWPEVENTTTATDTVTLALGDEIVQSQLLSTTLSTNGQMSVELARVKLGEARARHDNVKAIIAEQRALALASPEYEDLLGQISDTKAQLSTIGFPARDIVVPERRDAYNAVEARLARLVTEQQAMLAAGEATAEQLRLTEENIAILEASLASAEGGMVTFGDGLVVPIVPAERLDVALGGVGGTARAAAADTAALWDELDGLGDTALKTQDVLEGFGKETADMLKGMFSDGRLSAEDFGDFLMSWGSSLLDRLLTTLFDPLGDALQNLFDGMLSGGGLFGGGGGGGGGFLSGIGDFFGNLLGFDTGGEMAVSGRNGIDRNVAAFRVSADENIKVVKRGQSEGRAVNVYIQTPNPAAFNASRGQISAQIARAVGGGGRFT